MRPQRIYLQVKQVMRKWDPQPVGWKYLCPPLSKQQAQDALRRLCEKGEAIKVRAGRRGWSGRAALYKLAPSSGRGTNENT